METTSALSNPTRLITVLSWRSCMLCGGSACASKNSCAPPAGTTYHKLPIGATFTSATACGHACYGRDAAGRCAAVRKGDATAELPPPHSGRPAARQRKPFSANWGRGAERA